MKVKILGKLNYQSYPITDDMVEIADEILMQIGITKQFDANGNIIDYVNHSEELAQLKLWFDVEYARLEQKYRRLYTLKQQCDDGASPYDKLMELYKEAEIKRKRIQQIEGLINE